MTGVSTMPKKKPRTADPADAAGTDLIRVNADLARKIAVVVQWDRTTTAKLLDPQLRGFVEKEYARVVSEMSKEVKG